MQDRESLRLLVPKSDVAPDRRHVTTVNVVIEELLGKHFVYDNQT